MFIDVLDSLCKANGTTVTAVCKELGISTSKPTAWRNGSAPNSRFVVMFANRFNVSTDFLLEVGEQELSAEKLKMFSLILSLPDDKVKALRQIAEQALAL